MTSEPSWPKQFIKPLLLNTIIVKIKMNFKENINTIAFVCWKNRTVLEGIKDAYISWKCISLLWNGEFCTIIIEALPKLVYKMDVIPVKIRIISLNYQKGNFQFHMKMSGAINSRVITEKWNNGAIYK